MIDPTHVDRVAVIGGGYAGLAAAVTLADAGCAVTLFEQAGTLGGRARRVVLEGVPLDNGQHLALGGYRTLLDLIDLVHGPDAVQAQFERIPLTLAPFGQAHPAPIALRARALPAPLHLGLGLLQARGLTWRDRLALIGGYRRLERAKFRCPPHQTVAECFAAAPRRAFEALWAPLCLAALNTAPEQASAQIFANVLREAFSHTSADSEFLIPANDLTELFPSAAARFVAERRGEIRIGVTVRRFAASGDAVALTTRGATERFAAVIVAVGPHQLAALVEDTLDPDPISPETGPDRTNTTSGEWASALGKAAEFSYEPITTVYLGYPESIPLPAPIARLDDAPGQWIFDRSGALRDTAINGARSLLSVVISAGGPHDLDPQPVLAARVDAQLRRLAPGLPECVWSRVISERRATYACTPGLVRPCAGRVSPRLYLAGDYTDPDLPATLEAAVRSGVAAGRAVLTDRVTGWSGAMTEPTLVAARSALAI